MRFLSCLFLFLVFSIACFGQQHKTAENFTAMSLDGQTLDLAALRGKVVLVAFWTTRCAVCAGETSKLNQLATNYKDKNVVFLGLTTDNATKAASFIKKKPFDFTIVPDSFGILLKYAEKDSYGNMLVGYPAYYLINQQGEIELKANGSGKKGKLESEINRLLK